MIFWFPTSIAVNIDQENQQKVGSNSQEDTFAYVNGHLDASINQVAVLDALKNHNSEYLYLRRTITGPLTVPTMLTKS